MKNFLFILILPIISSAQLYGDLEIGRINGSGNYPFAREAPTVESKAIDSLVEGQIIRYKHSSSESWLESYSKRGGKVYINKSMIVNFNQFSRDKKKKLIQVVFEKEKSNYQLLLKGNSNRRAIKNYHEKDFNNILKVFIDYQKKEFDKELMLNFFELLKIESGSADELPAWTLGYIYLVHPHKMVNLVQEFDSESIYDFLLFGFDNVRSRTNDKSLLKLLENLPKPSKK